MLQGYVSIDSERAIRYRASGYWRGDRLDSILLTNAVSFPHAIALIDGNRSWSYADLDAVVDRLAAGWLALGLQAGDRVLIHLPNVAEFIQTLFALCRIGVIPVLALPAHREHEIVHLAEISQATAYVIQDTHGGFDYRAIARNLKERNPSVCHVIVVGDAADFIQYGSLLHDPVSHAAPSSSDVALLLLSGGTTGLPKLIPRTHDDYSFNARASAEVGGVMENSRYLAVLPVAHNFPLACPGVLGVLYAGGTVVLSPSPSPDDAFPLIERHRITHTALVPPLALLWMEATAWIQSNLSSLEVLQVGGSRLPDEAAARVESTLGCVLQQVYGMAEGLLNFTRMDDPEEVILHTQGRPLCLADEIRIVDEEDRPVPDGNTGELLTRGPYTIRGYYRADEFNRTAFTEDGFYRSGDLVRKTPEGNLIVEGRKKDVINRGGEKIPVEDLESALLAHPSVYEAAVVGVPDVTLGERSCGCIIPRGKEPSLAELNSFLAQSGLAAYKLLDRLLVLPELPRTSLGKVNKRQLAELASEHLPASGQSRATT